MYSKKRNVIFLLLAVFMISMVVVLCSCGKPDDQSTKPKKGTTTSALESLVSTPEDQGVDSAILDMAKNGELSPVEIKLGTYIMKTYEIMGGDPDYQDTSLEPYFEYDGVRFYYDDHASGKPINAITYLGDSYGMTIGFTKPDSVMSTLGEPDSKGEATEEELYFMPIALNGVYRITYQAGSNKLSFFFQKDMLIATELSGR